MSNMCMCFLFLIVPVINFEGTLEFGCLLSPVNTCIINTANDVMCTAPSLILISGVGAKNYIFCYHSQNCIQ